MLSYWLLIYRPWGPGTALGSTSDSWWLALRWPSECPLTALWSPLDSYLIYILQYSYQCSTNKLYKGLQARTRRLQQRNEILSHSTHCLPCPELSNIYITHLSQEVGVDLSNFCTISSKWHNMPWIDNFQDLNFKLYIQSKVSTTTFTACQKWTLIFIHIL